MSSTVSNIGKAVYNDLARFYADPRNVEAFHEWLKKKESK